LVCCFFRVGFVLDLPATAACRGRVGRMGKHDEQPNPNKPETDGQGTGPIPPPADPGKHGDGDGNPKNDGDPEKK
jgi:hypothetical protein